MLSQVFFFPGCGIKVDQLPFMSYPVVSEVEFLKEVRNVEGKAKKKHFKDDRVTSPFFSFIKLDEVENNGVLSIRFYTDFGKESREIAGKEFEFGEAGKYYEYIMFFDVVEKIEPGTYRYGIFVNDRLLYEGKLIIYEFE